MYSSKIFIENYLKESDPINTVLNVGMAAGGIAGLGSLGLGAIQLVGPSITKAINNLKYDMFSCNKIVDANDRDLCDIRSLNKVISRLRKQYEVVSKKGDKTTLIKLNNMIKIYQTKISKLEEDIAYRKNQAGIQ